MGWLNRIKTDFYDWIKFQRYYGLSNFTGNSKEENIPAGLTGKLEQAR